MTVDFRYRKRGYVVLQVTDITKSASFYMIDATGDQPLIVDKKVVLKNSYISQVIDIYHV